jgi:hypothetical protein
MTAEKQRQTAEIDLDAIREHLRPTTDALRALAQAIADSEQDVSRRMTEFARTLKRVTPDEGAS